MSCLFLPRLSLLIWKKGIIRTKLRLVIQVIGDNSNDGITKRHNYASVFLDS